METWRQTLLCRHVEPHWRVGVGRIANPSCSILPPQGGLPLQRCGGCGKPPSFVPGGRNRGPAQEGDMGKKLVASTLAVALFVTGCCSNPHGHGGKLIKECDPDEKPCVT